MTTQNNHIEGIKGSEDQPDSDSGFDPLNTRELPRLNVVSRADHWRGEQSFGAYVLTGVKSYYRQRLDEHRLPCSRTQNGSSRVQLFCPTLCLTVQSGAEATHEERGDHATYHPDRVPDYPGEANEHHKQNDRNRTDCSNEKRAD